MPTLSELQARLSALQATERDLQAQQAAHGAEARAGRAALQRLQARLEIALSRGLPTEAIEAAIAEAEARLQAVETAAAEVGDRLAGVRAEIAEVRAEIAQLTDPLNPLSPEHPIALLPVRLETRFAGAPGARELLVRVYPDDVHVVEHAPGLTDGEVAAATRYWERIWRAGVGGVDAERAAFVELARRVGPTRALWVSAATAPDPAGRPTAPVPDDRPLESLPVLRDVARTPGQFGQPAVAGALPDAWIVLGYRGGREVIRRVGSPIAPVVQVGPSPDATLPGAPDGERAPVEDGLVWMIDFAAAERAGMGIRVPLGEADAEAGFDRLVVLGVRVSTDPERSLAELTRVLDGHRYTRGLGFLPAGAPTNNTGAGRTPWSVVPDPEALFALGQAAAATSPAAGSNAAVAAAALGLSPETLDGLAHGGEHDQDDTRRMHLALWPATLGYFLETLLFPVPADADVEAGRAQFIEYVRGLGPLPTLRVGRQPYGLLPVTSLGRFRPGPGDETPHAAFVAVLRQLVPEWLAATRPGAARSVPYVGRPGADPDQELLAVLGRDAVSGSYRLRTVRGGAFVRALTPLVAGLDPAGPPLVQAVLELYGRAAQPPRMASFEFDPRSPRVRRPLVVDGAPSESEPLPPLPGLTVNYLRFVAERRERAGDAPSGPGTETLLFTLARRSAALADADAAVRMTRPASVIARKAELEPELIDPVAGTTTPTVPRLLAARASEATGGTVPSALRLGDVVATLSRAQVQAFEQPHLVDAYDRAQAVRVALGDLADRPSAALDRLVRALLDCCSHRLDAWITSYATRRLAAVRRARPTGVHLGGFGWVEDLRPKPPARAVGTPPDGETGPLVEDPTNAGFVVAPSLSHAATAAILLSGHLSHRAASTTGAVLAVDLASDRARTALWVLDGVRQGQPLAALLGYRFERGLHDASRPGLELDRFIRPFRALAPLVAAQREAVAESVEAVEAVAASNVVDGLALVRRFRGAGVEPALAGATAAERQAVLAQLAALDAVADALADLLVAESVHQAADGNLTRAAATLDALGSGTLPPPTPEVVRTPRSAFAFACRLLTLAPLETTPPPGWAGGKTRPRRLAEPRLDRWAAAFLGRGDRIRAAARLVGPDGASLGVREVTADEAGLCALDLVHDGAGAPGASVVEAWMVDRVVAAAPASVPDGTRVELLHPGDPEFPGGTWPADVLPLDDALELAAWLRGAVTDARPATLRDLRLAGAGDPGVDRAELATRATAVRAALDRAAATLDTALRAAGQPPTLAQVAAVRRALAGLAAFGLGGTREAARDRTGPSVDDPATAGSTVLAAAASVALAVSKLRAAEEPVSGDGASPLPPEVRRIHAVLGDAFTVLPLCRPGPDWAAALTAGARPEFLDGDAAAPLAWLQRVGPVRERVARFLLATTAAGRAADPVRVAQLPPAERWVALPLAASGTPPSMATSVIVHATAALDASRPVAGLVLDDWVDVVPRRESTAGVAFHFDEPGARAPQAVLLAVPPVVGGRWSVSVLADIVSETADLARIRMVGPGEVPWLGRFLPALYVADNSAGDTVRTNLSGLVQP
jgi:hypothetical protein